jgi:prepilin-type N-terminal cleavage/methylation domain-containing protein
MNIRHLFILRLVLMRRGFSLIELLVVIAIIGILAAVGLVGYQLYIDATKDDVSTDVGNFIDRTINTDVVSIENNLTSRSALTQDIDTSNKCWQMVSNIVTYVNGPNDDAGKSNSFNAAQGSLCDGVHAASGGTDITLSRGRTIVYCDGLDTVSHKIRLSNGINIRRCTCTESDCILTAAERRCVARLTAPVSTSSTSISFTIQPYSQNSCIDSTTTTLYISGQVAPLQVSSCSATSCTVTSPPAINDATLIYENDPSVCYYPFGFSSRTDFFNGLDNHTGGSLSNATDYARHICE